MRNINTSFIKNAISLFASEANYVLRAFSYANPATFLLRLIQSVVRTLLEQAKRQYRLSQVEQPATGDHGTPTTLDRILSVMSDGNLDRKPGNGRWDCCLSLSSS